MPIEIVRNDITKMECDAIVNAANPTLLGGGGVDGAIHRAAGSGLLEECRKLGGCGTGEAKITGAYDLPCKYVIHTVGPIWQDGRSGEEESLKACYRNSLELAVKYGCESVAFPLISAGAYGYPKEEALQAAIGEIGNFLSEHELSVFIVIYDRGSFLISRKLRQEITEYIDECYVESHFMERSRSLGALPQQESFAGTSAPYRLQQELPETHLPSQKLLSKAPEASSPPQKLLSDVPKSYSSSQKQLSDAPESSPRRKKLSEASVLSAPWRKKEKGKSDKEGAGQRAFRAAQPTAPLLSSSGVAQRDTAAFIGVTLSQDLQDMVSQIDESFSQMLLRKIDERGMTDAECYKKANIDRKLFSKIRSDIQYKPSKPTAIAFAIALELSPEETRELLMKAGYALSHSNKFDIIVEFFINRRNYNIFEINEALFSFDQSLLGAH
ncbi:MAG: macro domain-containing protein [Roseburia sp.]|nr:macro domain-containing protein [Roseburia sp.]MCM1098335.1 macro domain-containing protein [Ruminococcus flavefaciens]